MFKTAHWWPIFSYFQQYLHLEKASNLPWCGIQPSSFLYNKESIFKQINTYNIVKKKYMFINIALYDCEIVCIWSCFSYKIQIFYKYFAAEVIAARVIGFCLQALFVGCTLF